MKKIAGIFIALIAVIVATVTVNSCSATQTITAKTGMKLWGENCIRCHNAPPSSDYSPMQWETIGMHMKLRANLTDDEAKKIVEFLKSGN